MAIGEFLTILGQDDPFYGSGASFNGRRPTLIA
jgi:hypothetical protein